MHLFQNIPIKLAILITLFLGQCQLGLCQQARRARPAGGAMKKRGPSYPDPRSYEEMWHYRGGGYHGGPGENDLPLGKKTRFNKYSPEVQEQILERLNDMVPQIAAYILKKERIAAGLEVEDDENGGFLRRRRDVSKGIRHARAVPPLIVEEKQVVVAMTQPAAAEQMASTGSRRVQNKFNFIFDLTTWIIIIMTSYFNVQLI